MRKVLSAVMLFLLVGCSSQGNEEGQEVSVSKGNTTVLADHLQVPWSIQKAADTFYISERPGTIVKVEGGQKVRQKVALRKPISGEAEAGFLGFVLHPDFAKNHQAFAYYTYDENGSPFNRLVVLTLQNDVWQETRVLIDRIPSGSFHHGGRVKMGPDGKLYFSAGDATIRENAQNVNSLNGKILRMNLDGSVPSDNPFRGSYIYSYGHRNPQGLAWDEAGNLYESEHGQSAHDELNKIVAGANYGWPVIEGNQKRQGMVTPIFQTGDVTWAPSGIAYHNGKLYVATLRGEALWEVDLKTMNRRAIITDVGRIRDVMVDGEYLYFISNNTDGRGNPAADDDKLYQVRLSGIQ